MPAFSFEALDAQGQTRKGLMEADTAKAARSLLRAQALVPLAVELVQTGQSLDGSSASLGQRLFTRPVFSATGLSIWTRQIAGLVSSGLPLERALKAKLVGAALYPAIVTIVAIVIVLFLVGYVVPQVASVFAGTKRALPFLTVAMLGISAFVRSYGWMMLIASVLIAFGTRWALTIGHVREKFDAAWLNLPLVGKLARGYNAARFAGTLA